MPPAPPNILILILDCLRADACYNEKTTLPLPHIDALRERGATFSQHFSVASTTSPCVTSMVTGVYPAIHGIRGLRGFRLREGAPTLATALAGAGYTTSAYLTGPLLPTVGLTEGFHTYECRDRADHIYGPFGERLLDLVGSPQVPGPWLTVAHTFVLHNPARRLRKYANSRYGTTLYQQALCNLDEYLGRLWERVDWDNTVVVLTADHGEIVSDRVWWWHTLGRKTGMHRVLSKLGITRRESWATGRHGVDILDSLIRVPLVMAGGPVTAAGLEVGAQVSQTDIFPTLAGLAGVPLDSAGPLRGVDHAAALQGGELPADRPIYAEACGEKVDPEDRLVAVRTEGWKCIFAPANPGIPPRLFRVSDDPEEATDLAAQRPEQLAALRKMIEDEYLAHLPPEESLMSEEDTRAIEDHLRDLGYL